MQERRERKGKSLRKISYLGCGGIKMLIDFN